MLVRSKRLLSVAVLGCVVAGLVVWWLWPRPRPNVILITIDTLRPDRLSAYGYTKNRTPNFDRLATEGVLFENAFCDVTWTTPSMASVMRDDPAPVTPAIRTQHFSEELYDLHANATETQNVISTHPDVAASFRQKVTEYQRKAGTSSEKLDLDEASRERLRTLGYLQQ